MPEDAAPPPAHLARVRARARAGAARARPRLRRRPADARELAPAQLTRADVSAVALERARARLPGAELVELEPDAPLPFADDAFDLVLCTETLEHVRDVQLLLSEVRRVLGPAARLAVTTPAHGRPPARVLIAASSASTRSRPTCASSPSARCARCSRRWASTSGRSTRARGTLLALAAPLSVTGAPDRHQLRRARARRARRSTSSGWPRRCGRAATSSVVEARQPRRARRRGGAQPAAQRRQRAARRRRGCTSACRAAARAARADVIHHPLPASRRGAPCPQVMTVHDLAFVRLPEGFGRVWRALAARAAPRARRARAARDLRLARRPPRDAVGVLGADPERVVVAPHGPGQALPRSSGGRRRRHFLYVGDDEPRKRVAAPARGATRATAAAREQPLAWCSPGASAARAIGAGLRGEPRPRPRGSRAARRRRGARAPVARRGLRPDAARGDGGRRAGAGGAQRGHARALRATPRCSWSPASWPTRMAADRRATPTCASAWRGWAASAPRRFTWDERARCTSGPIRWPPARDEHERRHPRHARASPPPTAASRPPSSRSPAGSTARGHEVTVYCRPHVVDPAITRLEGRARWSTCRRSATSTSTRSSTRSCRACTPRCGSSPTSRSSSSPATARSA